MNKIKVLNIIWSMGDGGAQRIVLNYLKYFKNDNDIDFKLLVYDKCDNSYCNRIIKKEKYNVEYLNKKRSIFMHVPVVGKFINYVEIQKLFEKKIKENKPDIVHVHISPLLKYVLKPIVNNNILIKFDTLHSNPLRFKGLELFFIKKAFQKYNFIPICLNEYQEKVAKEYYGFNKYEIIRNGIDFEQLKSKMISKEVARKKYNISLDSFVVLSVGRLNSIKRFDYLIKCFNECLKINKKSVLLIAGAGNELSNLSNLILSLNLTNKVKLLGNVDDIIPLYCCADVFALCSQSEASSLVTIEAQLCNLRCVVSDGIPNESIITNKVKKMKNNATEKEWVDALLDDNYEGKIVCDSKEYELKNTNKKMKQIYMKYWEEYNEKK